ncbi:MAG TPA: acyl-CoA dehydrogenase [Alphaproteobacteria bacterium]|nr:acyl-CoA dehydrogenase [Alphaproteobacteria bacterium]
MSELRTMLADTVNRLFEDMITAELLTAAEQGEWPDALWRAVEENGLTMPLVSEAHGGVGCGWLDARVVLHGAGRYSAPIPLAETILASWLLDRAGIEPPHGPMSIAGGADGAPLRLTREPDGWRADGECPRVPWGGRVDHIVLVAPAEGGVRVGLVGKGEFSVTQSQNMAREPRDTLRFDNAPVNVAGTIENLPADTVTLFGALIRTAQVGGALERALHESVLYANDRVQFGKPIGKFQAVQQNLAQLADEVAAVGAAGSAACAAVDLALQSGALDDAWFRIAAGKARAGEAAGKAASIAHQAHGAFGFTYEHILHFSTRRLWSWRAEYGTGERWAEALGKRVVEIGADNLWEVMTAND